MPAPTDQTTADVDSRNDDPLTVLREELVKQLRAARADAEAKQRAYAAPYSGHDAAVAHNNAQGVWRGIAAAVETLDKVAAAAGV